MLHVQVDRMVNTIENSYLCTGNNRILPGTVFDKSEGTKQPDLEPESLFV